jgi:branched-chain amino acid transport system ATP-binding protein
VTALLQLLNVTRSFGGLRAVDDVSFAVAAGEVLGLIGPNGAGKTTLINMITGVHPATGGKVVFDGRDITRLKSHKIARLGLSRTFQIVQPFPKMTVLENVAAGALFGGRAASLAEASAAAMEQLRFTGLAQVADQSALSLTLAQRKRLEFAKGLAMQPRILMLDEVNAGLNATEIEEALTMIRKVAERGVTIILIEHLLKVVTAVAERVVVLHHGRLIAEGTPGEVLRDGAVIEAYLGAKYAARYAATA